jgi:hypothetical protein
MSEEKIDYSGQAKEVLVSTKNGAADHGIKTNPATPEALRKAIPPTPLSQRLGDQGGVHRRGSTRRITPQDGRE